MSKKKTCSKCESILKQLAEEYKIDCEHSFLPSLLEEKLEEEEELEKTFTALRETYANSDAYMTKENAVMSIELQEAKEELIRVEREIADARRVLEKRGIDVDSLLTK